MRTLITLTTVLIISLFQLARAEELPFRVLMNRPAEAPNLEIPRFDRIDTALLQKGKVRVIVRLTPPDNLSGGFVVESHMKDIGAISRQRDAITRKQRKVLEKMTRKHAARAKQFGFIPFMAVEVDQDDFQTLASSPDVDFIQEDIVVFPDLRESIPLIGGVGGAFDGATGAGQTVAVLDTGVDRTHPFLAGKVVAEACYSTNSPPDAITSLCPNGLTSMTGSGSGVNCSGSLRGCYHGTHVAGIAAGNNASFGGVAKDAGIIAIQVFSRGDSSASCSGSAPCIMAFSSDLISAMDRVYTLKDSHPIAAVNMSLGGGLFTTNCDTEDPATTAAINTLRAAGVATVVAAGNNYSSTGISFPACISSAISVGATTKTDVVDGYSNSAAFLTLLAPGTSIYSSLPGTGFGYLSGTSMATPHVAGAWAVLKSVKPSTAVSEALTMLTTTGVPITDPRNRVVKPRIRLDAAVTALKATLPVSVAVSTFPDGLDFSVDSQNYHSGQTFNWTPGSSHTLAILTSPQAGATGTQYVFTNWTDSGAQSHSYTVPATASTLTANFGTEYQLTTAVTPAGKGTVSPVSGNWFAADSVTPVKAFPNVGYSFGSWSGPVAVPTSAATTVTMSGPQTITASVTNSPALNAAITAASGLPNARLWTIKLTNSGQGFASGAHITGLTLIQTYGTACTRAPAISPLPIPVSPVDVAAAGGTATGQVTIDFSNCPSTARFTAVIGFDANGGTVTGTKSYGNQTR